MLHDCEMQISLNSRICFVNARVTVTLLVYMRTAVQEIHETHADMAHLSQVHGPIKLAGVDLQYTHAKWCSFARHEWTRHWNQDNNSEHIGLLNAYHRLFLLGRHLFTFDCTVQTKQVPTTTSYL